MGQLIPGHKYLLDIAPWGIQSGPLPRPLPLDAGDALQGAELDYETHVHHPHRAAAACAGTGEAMITKQQYDDEHDHTHDENEEMVQCESCKEWWREGEEGCPQSCDYLFDNVSTYCLECRREILNVG